MVRAKFNIGVLRRNGRKGLERRVTQLVTHFVELARAHKYNEALKYYLKQSNDVKRAIGEYKNSYGKDLLRAARMARS